MTPAALTATGSDYAQLTLPDSIEIKKSQIPTAGDGAWTKCDVPKRVRYGPYLGQIVRSEDAAQSGYCWKVRSE